MMVILDGKKWNGNPGNGDYTGTHYSDNGDDYYNCSWW